MKYTIILALTVLSLHATNCADAAKTASALSTVTCKPVLISAGAELPASIDFQDRPMGHILGFEIAYLVEATDLIGFKKDSLSVTSITAADGKDISKKRNGKPSYELGSFPKTTDDGKYGIFQIKVSENQFGKLDNLKIVGTIVALTGNDRQTKTLTMKLSETKIEEVGGLKISLKAPKSTKADNDSPFGAGFGSGSSNSLGVQVDGELIKVADLIVLDGTSKLKAQSANWSDTRKTYDFAKPTGDTVTIEVSYWNKFGTVTVAIGK
jgi:hypothetical protein